MQTANWLSLFISRSRLRAPARAATAMASVTTAVAGHDAAAEAACWRVAQVDDAGQSVGGVDGTSSDCWVASRERCLAAHFHSLRTQDSGLGTRLWPEIFKQHLLLAGQKAQLEPAEDVVHDRLGVADVGVAAPAAGLEARVRELFAEYFQRRAVLQRERNRQRKTVHQARDGRTL